MVTQHRPLFPRRPRLISDELANRSIERRATVRIVGASRSPRHPL